MIIEVNQKEAHVEVSYTNDTGGISITNIPVENGYKNWVICDEGDPEKHQTIRNWDNSPVKKVLGDKFYDLNLHEFLQVGAPKPTLATIHKATKPHFFSVDIETEITDDAMPDCETAPTKILSISITAQNMATVILSLKSCDMSIVQDMLDTELAQWAHKYDFKVKHIAFDTERDMLEYFCTKCRDIFHVIGGWNYLGYDNIYIKNRCKKVGINYNICSPVNELDHNGIPRHRLIIDYMQLYAQRPPSDLQSMKLDAVAEYELGMHKLKYDKTLRELYRDEYEKFIAYAIIDTILVMLLHLKTKKIDLLYNMSYYCQLPFKNCGKQIAQADALIFKKFWGRGLVYANERVKNNRVEYPGAFVKEPVFNEVSYSAAYDAKSLYPSTGLTLSLSPDSYLGKCKPEQVRSIRDKGFIVTDRLSVYKKDKSYLFTELWEDLRLERDIYKGAMFRIWQDLEGKIEIESKARGIELKIH